MTGKNKNRNRTIFFITILAVVYYCSICKSAMAITPINVEAVISSIDGEVQVQLAGSFDWTQGKEKMRLKSGDKIKTGAKSTCVIIWNRDSLIKLTSFTSISIDMLDKKPSSNAESSSFGLWSGKVFGKAAKMSGPQSSFIIKTPTAVAAVRGTILAVSVDAEQTTTVECLNGIISVTGGKGSEVILTDNQMTVVKAGQEPSAPSSMTTQEQDAFSDIPLETGLTLDITQPRGDLDTDVSPVVIKGIATPGSMVKVNDNPVTTDAIGSFTASVDLQLGTNQVRIEASNKNGVVTQKTIVIKYNPVSQNDSSSNMNVVISSPLDGAITRNNIANVIGTMNPGVKIRVNGIPVDSIPGHKSFAATVNLSEGKNVITIIASLRNEIVKYQRTVTKDTLAPQFTMIKPAALQFDVDAEGCLRSGSGNVTCTIIGMVSEPGCSLTINNITAIVGADGSFSQSMVFWETDTNLTLTAVDPAGNSTTINLTRVIKPSTVEYITLTVNPNKIVANKKLKANVEIKTYNFFKQPVDAAVSISTTSGGTLSSYSTRTIGGTAEVTFTPPNSEMSSTATITAVAGPKSTSAVITILPDVPPAPDTPPSH